MSQNDPRSVSLGFNIKVGWTRSENIVTTPRTKRFFDIELLPRHHLANGGPQLIFGI